MPQAATTTTRDDRALLVETEERLVARWTAEGVAPDTVRGAVAEAFERLAGARVRSFLPILVERRVRLQLSGV
ncbi:three-helix bundle dimerization domain-containing protein [Actinomycetospora sp. CA-084318]|uniref:three-helix bundle dimerization domain-containing protein n=1 Tax=Actinomycetospora sp. CA-084318 TaxID=3239892 RepID=UPI003D966239